MNINANAISQLENSDITANAIQGRGANIQINTQGVFASFDSEITAASERGINGVVNVTNVDVRQDNSFKQQANQFIDIERVLSNSCIAHRNYNQGSFVVTGNGGFTESPYNSSSLEYSIAKLIPISSTNTISSQLSQTKPVWKVGDRVEEATQLILNQDGKILLVSNTNKYFNSATNLTCVGN